MGIQYWLFGTHENGNLIMNTISKGFILLVERQLTR